MKPRISLVAGRQLKWLALLVALVLLPGVVGAAERLLIPEDLDLPFYACGLGHTADGAWVGAAFYRPLDKAPGKFAANEFVAVDPDKYPLCVRFRPRGAVLGGAGKRREGDVRRNEEDGSDGRSGGFLR